MSNQAFGVNNTTNDITNSGPVAQELALHKGAILFADVVNGTQEPLSMGSVKQAALGTTIIVEFDPTGKSEFQFTLNKATGAPDGSVAAALVKELNFKRVGDCSLLHFFACQRFTAGGEIQIASDDASVLSNALLFDGVVAEKLGGEAIAEIRAVNVTPGAEIVALFDGDNAFV